jgi:hypothetical protein
MSRTRPLTALVLAAAVSVAACDSITSGSSGNPIGVGGITARTKGSGFTTDPQIGFYRVSSASFMTTSGVPDTCFIAAYSTSTSSGGTTSATALSAGPSLVFQVGSRTDTLKQAGPSLDPVYKSVLASGIPYTPGDSFVVTVPGSTGGFPPGTFRGRTAEAFTVAPVTLPATGTPMTVNWTPAGDGTSAMYMTFRYYGTATSTDYDRQVACSFADDGSGTIPATMAGLWVGSTKRDLLAQRMRAMLSQVDVPRAYFNLVSTFDWPTPVSP